MKAYEERSGLRVSTGSFYRELGRLLAEGLVRAAANPPGADPRRTPYAITETGAAVFDEWFASRPGDPSNSDDELAGRAIFFRESDPAVTRPMLDHWRDSLWLRSKMLERERKVALAANGTGEPAGFDTRALLISRRLAHVAADIEFLDRLSAAYEECMTAAERVASRTKPPDRRAKVSLRK